MRTCTARRPPRRLSGSFGSGCSRSSATAAASGRGSTSRTRRSPVDALERAQPGVYNVADDDPAPVADWLPYLASVVGAPQPLRVPVWLGRLLAGDAVVGVMTQARGASNEKARTELVNPDKLHHLGPVADVRAMARDLPRRRSD